MVGQKGNRQREVLAYLKAFIEANGYAPSCQEISEALGLSGRSHAAYYLGSLARLGYLERKPSAPRAVVLTELGTSSPQDRGISK